MANRQLKARRPSPSRFGDADRTATPAQPTLFRGGKIFTIQPFSRKCPIGHALDIPFENWTSSLRIYRRNNHHVPVIER